MLWKCRTQYASKFGKLSSGHRTGKGQFSFQSQRKAMPKKAQTTAQLHSSHTLASSVQFSSITQLCPTLWDPMNHSMPGLPVNHQLLEFTQTQVYRVSDAIQPSHPLSSPYPPASWQQMLSFWSLVPLPFLNPASTSSSWFVYHWSLAWRILSITLLACEMSATVW